MSLIHISMKNIVYKYNNIKTFFEYVKMIASLIHMNVIFNLDKMYKVMIAIISINNI